MTQWTEKIIESFSPSSPWFSSGHAQHRRDQSQSHCWPRPSGPVPGVILTISLIRIHMGRTKTARPSAGFSSAKGQSWVWLIEMVKEPGGVERKRKLWRAYSAARQKDSYPHTRKPYFLSSLTPRVGDKCLDRGTLSDVIINFMCQFG